MITFHFSAAIDCGNLIVPEGGRVTFTPGVVMTLETGLDAVGTYTCSEGYDLVGDSLRTCEANGQWDGGEPTCMGMCTFWRYTSVVIAAIFHYCWVYGKVPTCVSF